MKIIELSEATGALASYARDAAKEPVVVLDQGRPIAALVAIEDARKPLRSKVLAVPALRKRYLEHMRTLAEESLDWTKLGPLVARYRALIEKEVEADTKKLSSFDDFQRTTADAPGSSGGGRRSQPPLRTFVEERRAFILAHPEVLKAAAPAETPAR